MLDISRQVGQRIRLAREAAGLSQEELGRLIGRTTGEPYSSTAISYFETGQRKVKLEDLPAFAAVLKKPIGYFLSVDGIGDMASESYRSPALATVLLRATPYLNPEAKNQVQHLYAHVVDLPASRPSIELDAEDLRKPANILSAMGYSQPPVDVKQVAEDIGLTVLEWDFDDTISGVLILDGEHKAIGVNKSHPYQRQRFSLAHELGHYCLGHNPIFDVDILDPQADRPTTVYERQANSFAAEILMPPHMVRRAYSRLGEDLPALAREFRVSQQAMWIRLLELGLAEETTMVAF